MLQIQTSKRLGKSILTIYDELDGEGNNRLSFRQQMLIHNHIPGLLPCEFINEGNRLVSVFYTENRITLEDYCRERKLNRDELQTVLQGIFNTVLSGHEFMLSEEDFLIERNHIYLDSEMNVFLAYYSGYGRSLFSQLCDLAEYLMSNVDYHDEQAVVMIYSVYMKTKESDCSIESLIAVIRKRGMVNSAIMPYPSEASKENQQKEITAPVNELIEKRKSIKPENKPVPDSSALTVKDLTGKAKMRFMATAGISMVIYGAVVWIIILKSRGIEGFSIVASLFSVLLGAVLLYWISRKRQQELQTEQKRRENIARAEEEQTQVLFINEDSKTEFSLVSDDREAINVTKYPYYIGKDKTYSDTILNSQGVSRFHMKIDMMGKDVVIADLNSTNGTYLNGERLAPHVPVKVRRGDEIRIANCIYYCN